MLQVESVHFLIVQPDLVLVAGPVILLSACCFAGHSFSVLLSLITTLYIFVGFVLFIIHCDHSTVFCCFN